MIGGLKHVKMNDSRTEPGAWWVEKETNDVIRIISKDNVWMSDVKGGPIYDGSIFYQYYSDDQTRCLMGTQWVSTIEDLSVNFKYKMG